METHQGEIQPRTKEEFPDKVVDAPSLEVYGDCHHLSEMVSGFLPEQEVGLDDLHFWGLFKASTSLASSSGSLVKGNWPFQRHQHAQFKQVLNWKSVQHLEWSAKVHLNRLGRNLNWLLMRFSAWLKCHPINSTHRLFQGGFIETSPCSGDGSHSGRWMSRVAVRENCLERRALLGIVPTLGHESEEVGNPGSAMTVMGRLVKRTSNQDNKRRHFLTEGRKEDGWEGREGGRKEDGWEGRKEDRKEGKKEGRKEDGREGRKMGGKEGRKEGKKEGRKE
ncbi:hypothetical protein L345_11683, partial [Ophiophagus hannah]